MVARVHQPARQASAGERGIGHEIERCADRDGVQERGELHRQRSVVAVGKFDPLMDPARERHGEKRARRRHQQGDHLHGVSHDVAGLGVALGLLIQQLHGGHLAATLGDLDPVTEHTGRPA